MAPGALVSTFRVPARGSRPRHPALNVSQGRILKWLAGKPVTPRLTFDVVSACNLPPAIGYSAAVVLLERGLIAIPPTEPRCIVLTPHGRRVAKGL
jgi:hypothetical protein